MKKNVGFVDRIIRFVIIDLLLGFSFMGFEISPILTNLAFIWCIVLALSIVAGYSPLYHLLGMSTRESKSSESNS